MVRILKTKHNYNFNLKIINVYIKKWDILNVKAPILKDDSIDEYEYFEYEPTIGTNLNSGGNIRIDIGNKDIFYHPSESYLNFEGELLREDGGNAGRYDNNIANAGDNLVTLTNNAMMYLFKSVRYQLEEQDIEYINYPGFVSTMLGLLKCLDDFSKLQGLNQLWYKDTGLRASVDTNAGFRVRRVWIFDSDPVGSFNFIVPLKHIFGFCEDYNKVVYGMKHTLTLTRTGDNNAIFKAASATDGAGNPTNNFSGKVVLKKISWFMPHVTPELGNRTELLKFIERKERFPVGYRMIPSDTIAVGQHTGFAWRLSTKSSPEVPRFIIVGFQSGKNNNQEQNTAIFDHINVRNISAVLSTKRYPFNEHQINFDTNLIGRIYEDAASFRKKIYNMDELVSNPNINPEDYKRLFPLFVFDVSKQSERIKYSITDIHIRANFAANPPPKTEAYAVLLCDRLINFQSDGNKMTVVY